MATPEAAVEAQLYRVLLAQASDLAAIIAADSTVRYRSPSYQRILGYSSADLHEWSVFEHIHPTICRACRPRSLRPSNPRRHLSR